MFFKIGSIKNFAIFTGKHTCVGLSFFLAGLEVCNFFKNKFQHRYFLWILQNLDFFLSDSPTTVQCLHVLSILIKNFRETQIIIYYHVTKQFLPCLN